MRYLVQGCAIQTAEKLYPEGSPINFDGDPPADIRCFLVPLTDEELGLRKREESADVRPPADGKKRRK